MSEHRRLCVLVNPTAGGGRKLDRLAEVEAALAEHGLDFHVERTVSVEHTTTLAREAAEAGDEVVAFGGDGMLRCVAHAVRGTGAVLGLLPGGRGNDFAAVLGIPSEPVAACAVLATGPVREVDAAEADGATFLSIASVGLDSEVNRLANAAPRIGGHVVYAGALLAGLARWRPAEFDLEVDGERHAFRGYTAAAANSGRYGGGMRLAPDARLDDGLLDLVLIEDMPRRQLLRKLPKVFAGTHTRGSRVRVLRAREVRLDADRPFVVYADGDPIGTTPVTVRALPGALRVRAP